MLLNQRMITHFLCDINRTTFLQKKRQALPCEPSPAGPVFFPLTAELPMWGRLQFSLNTWQHLYISRIKNITKAYRIIQNC